MSYEPVDPPRADPQYWNSLASRYDGFYEDEWSRLEDEVTLEMVERVVTRSGCRVLDVGCGTGFGFSLCNELKLEVDYTGIDISPGMIQVARQRYPGATFVCDDGNRIGLLGTERFDVLLMLNGVLSFVAKPEAALRQASMLLRRRGGVLVSGLGRYSLRNLLRARWGRYERYATRGASRRSERTTARGFSRGELRALFQCAQIDVSEIRGVGFFAGVAQWPPLWKVDRVFSRVLPSQAHLLWASGSTVG